jgi:hypothetical protein
MTPHSATTFGEILSDTHKGSWQFTEAHVAVFHLAIEATTALTLLPAKLVPHRWHILS